jgi:hypothetical protein
MQAQWGQGLCHHCSLPWHPDQNPVCCRCPEIICRMNKCVAWGSGCPSLVFRSRSGYEGVGFFALSGPCNSSLLKYPEVTCRSKALSCHISGTRLGWRWVEGELGLSSWPCSLLVVAQGATWRPFSTSLILCYRTFVCALPLSRNHCCPYIPDVLHTSPDAHWIQHSLSHMF